MEIIAPEFCPSCNSELEYINSQLYCVNDTCPAKTSKQLINFAKKLSIKGLGPATIEKLCLTSIGEIYKIEESEIREVLGDATGSKVFDQIQKSKAASLNEVLPALGIPLVGDSAAEKLCTELSHFEEVTKELCNKAGLGPKVTSNIINYKNTFPWRDLPFSFKSQEVKKASEDKGVVCITGKLTTFKTKNDAKKELEAIGYKVVSTVTKEVTILVNESGVESSKTQKAREKGVKVIENLEQLLKEN
tara:strand:+ start:126 stop:866 length:741 start_codon:yes stop_codon:yes gene_type:complete